MSITMTKLMFAIPMAFFALRLIVQYIVGHHEEDPEMLQKALRSMICFFMTACATTFYKGKGDFTKKLSWKLPRLRVQRKAPPAHTLLFISIHSFLKYL